MSRDLWRCSSCGFEDSKPLRDGVDNHWRSDYQPGIRPTSQEAICYAPLQRVDVLFADVDLHAAFEWLRGVALSADGYHAKYAGALLSDIAALCQRCHNRHDAKSRREGIRQRRIEASGQMTLLQARE